MRDCFPVLLIVLAGCAQETSPSPVAAAPADPPLAAAVPTELPTLRYYSLPG